MKLEICFEAYKFLFENPLFVHLTVIYVIFSDVWFQFKVMSMNTFFPESESRIYYNFV